MDRAIELLSLYREDIDATQIAEILWLSQYINITPNKKSTNFKPLDDTETEDDYPPLPPEKNSPQFNEVQYTILINSHKGTLNDSGEDFGFERNNNTSYSVGFTQVDNFPNILKQFESLRFKEKKLDKNILDEEKTADKIALIGFFHPIFQEVQNRENYFDLNIIIDESKSMFLWKEHIKHFIKSIRLSSVFNYINIIHLDSSEDKALFKDEKSNNLRFDAPLFKRDRRLTLIFTDVVGKAWRTNHMFTVIDSWSKYSFVSIVSMLPNHMWQKTPLRQGVNAFMKSNKVLPKNKDLKLEYNFIERKIGSVNTKIPIISYDDSSFLNLSNVITAKKDSWIDARIFGELKTKSLTEKLPLNISAEERVERFFASSLPETRKLAIYCSVLPLHKIVIEKLIREKSLGQGMNAFVEFYFGGLLDRDAKVNSNEYEFYKGVRRELISYISVEGIESLFKLLNDVISQSLGLNTSIVDLLYADSSTLNNLGKKEKNIANFLIDILKEKGKYFKKQVDSLTNMAQKKSINFSMIQVSEVNLEIGKNLVSTEEYNLFCEDTKRKIVSSDLDKDTQPIINISWNDAQSYCIWLSKKLGEKYRLPSKSEREYFSKKIDFLEDTNDNISEWCEEKVFWSSSKKKSDIGFRVIKEFKTIGGVSNSLSIEELKTIISQEENEKLEFKTRWNQPVQNLVKYILSLTNGSSKHIDKTAYFIIGVDERDKNSFKLKKDEVLVIFSELQELLNEYTKPEITGLLIEWYNLEEDNGVLVISIPPQTKLISLSKDIRLRNRTDRKGTIYYRVNDNIRIASDKIIEKFIQAYGIILLYKEDDLDVDLLKLVQYLNDVCGYLTFEVGKESFAVKDKKVSWSESYKNLNSAIHEETKYSIGAFFFTKKPYNNNYFFEGNTAFPNLMIVSFSGWSGLSSLPYSNAIAYFVAEILSLDLSSFQHQDSTGCLYDFSSNKADIDKNMREAYICKDCYSRIEDNKSDVNMKVLKDIESILEVVGRASSNDLDILEDRNNPNKNNILSVKELEKIISQGEGAKVEFKREWYRKEYLNEFVKDFFSLANGDIYTVKDTAYLIIGIDDRKEIYDFDKFDIPSLDEFKKMLFYKLNSYAEFHTIDFKIEWYKIENKKILVISIPPQNKLIYLSTDMKLRNRIDRKGTTYYRVGEDIRIASPDVIRDFDKAFNLKKNMTLSCDEVIKYTVEVKYKENKGSGFILKLDNIPNSFFVITAKHIFVNDFNSSNDNIVIDEVLISYKSEVIVPNQIILLEADIIAFVFDNSVSNIIDNLTTIPLASSPNQFKESIFAGYNIGDNLICQKCSYSHKLEEKNLYQIASNREYDTNYISGVGGSGLFIKENGYYSIVGMVVQYDEMVSAFRYIALAPYIKEIIDRVELLQNKRTEDIKEKKNDSVEEKIKKVLLDELTKWNNTFSNISFLTKNIEFAQNINNSMHFINQLIEIVKISEYDDLAPLFDNVNQLEESNKNKKSFSFKYDPKDILIYQLEEAISFLLPLSSLVLYDNSKKVINSLIKTLNKTILIIQNMSMHELENTLDKNNVILNSINEFGLKPISNSDKNNTIENVSNSIENFEQTIEYIKNYKDLLLEEGIKNIIISYPFDTYSLKEFREAILKDFDWMQTYLHNLNNSNNYIKDSNSKFYEHYCSFYRFLCDEIADDLLIIKLFLHIKDIYCAKKDTKYFYNLEASWLKHLENEFSQPYMQTLKNFLQEEKAQGKTILPKESLWFNALDSTPLHEVKVVILGQDPYPTIGHAHGLSFSALPEVHPFPKSLINIYKELQDDLDIDNFHTPYLQPWAEQGVLLLNAVLTVEAGKANSHQGKGWEQFTDKIIEIVNQECNNVVFLLWGAYAQKKGSFIDITRHMIIKSPNPSPLSAFRGFLGSRPFSRTNDYLTSKGKKPIDWQLYKDQESKKKNNLKFKVLDKFEQEVFKNKYEADIINFLNSHRPDEFEYKEIYADWLPSDNNDAYIVAYDGAESVEINNINKSEPNQYQVGITMEYIVEIELNIFKYDYAGNDEEYTLIESLNDHYYTVGKEVTLNVEAELYFELYEENEFLESECVLKIKDIEILDERKENNGDIGAIESAQSANVLLKNTITYLQDNKKYVIQDIVNSLEEGEKKYIVDLLENKKSFIKSVDNHFLWMIDYMKELNNEKVNLDSLTIIESLYPVYCDFYREFAIYIEKNKIPDNIKKILKKFSNEIANKYKCN